MITGKEYKICRTSLLDILINIVKFNVKIITNRIKSIVKIVRIW